MQFRGVLTTLVFTIAACANPTIERPDVERIINTLAHDSMAGRATFSREIDMAAAFIRSEFEDIGLDVLEGEAGYIQDFAVSRITVEQATVRFNGRDIPASRFAIAAGQETLNWDGTADVTVERVSAEDELFRTFSRLRRAPGNTLVLVDAVHSGSFGQIARFLDRPRNVTTLGRQNAVWIVTADTEARDLEVTATMTIESRPLANVVGVIPGRRAEEIVLFSAHYDHIGIRPAVDGDSIANGANDDASGTTAVIALARYFKALGRPERTLVFAAFTGEESGGFGSNYFSQHLDPDRIVAMFNIEMIGKPATDGPNTAWITGFERSTFGEILQRAVEGTQYRFYADPYPNQNLFYRSDNATLARLGVPAHSISTTPIDVDPDYHQVTDHVETLDLDHLTNTIIAIAAAARTIVSGDETPTRVDTTQVN